MGLPIFPNLAGPAPQADIIDRLLETIALEELALAAVVNAEAEKVQTVALAGIMGPVAPDELTAINESVAKVLSIVERKEEQLRRKLNRILAHKEATPPPNGPNGQNGPGRRR